MRFICVLITAALPLIAQSQSGDLSVSGVVVNSETGEPVKNALVTLNETEIPKPESDGSFQPFQRKIPKKPRTAMAGASGEFAFYGLTEGNVMLSAQKPGFTADPKMGVNQNFELKASVGDQRILLVPLGVIEGKVVDQDGGPLWGVSIIALQASVVDGVRTFNQVRSEATDDRGVYRISGLMAGKYYIKAAGRGGGTFRYLGGQSPYYPSWESFAPVYAGGARSVASATPIEVGAGTDRSVDFALTMEPAYRIRGTLATGGSNSGVTFELVQGDEKVAASRASLHSTTGNFEVQDVLPGNYVLRAAKGTEERGEVTVSVRGADVEGVMLTMSPAVTVTGVIRLVGEEPKEIRSATDSVGGACQLSLRERGGRSFTGGQETAIVIQSVLPGEYTAGVSCFAAYPISVMAGSQDLMRNSKYVVSPGVAPTPIEIQAKWGGGRIQGKLETKVEAAEPGRLLQVLALPALSGSEPFMEQATPDPESQKGDLEFEFEGLRPGDYTLYAFARQDIEFRNPAFLQTLSGGVTVHVEENQETQVTLTKVIE